MWFFLHLKNYYTQSLGKRSFGMNTITINPADRHMQGEGPFCNPFVMVLYPHTGPYFSHRDAHPGAGFAGLAVIRLSLQRKAQRNSDENRTAFDFGAYRGEGRPYIQGHRAHNPAGPAPGVLPRRGQDPALRNTGTGMLPRPFAARHCPTGGLQAARRRLRREPRFPGRPPVDGAL